MKVIEIDPAGHVQLGSFHPLQSSDIMLSVRLQKPQLDESAFDPKDTIKNVPMPKLHELSVGEFVLVTGTVTKVNTMTRSMVNYVAIRFTIDLDGAKIE
jgi:hypothetical protein